MLRAFRMAAWICALLLAALMLHAGEPSALWWWGTAIPFALWIIGAAIAPYLLAARLKSPSATLLLFSFFALSNLFSGIAYADAFFRSTSSTSALIMVFMPLYQWLAFIVVGPLCVMLHPVGRRRRSGHGPVAP